MEEINLSQDGMIEFLNQKELYDDIKLNALHDEAIFY